MDTGRMARFTPPTPRSRRLGRELRRIRDGAKLTLDDAGRLANCSPSRVARVESGEIKVRPGDVMELLVAYGAPIDDERGKALLAMARDIREPGWWQRLDTLPVKYATYIAYEAEATGLRHYESSLVPGLLQTEAYARSIIAIGRETEAEAIEQRVQARMTRQKVLTRKPPLRLWAIISEAALYCEIGSQDIVRKQLNHLVEMGGRPNITIQILPFAAGGHLAVYGGFSILSFGQGDPDLGYTETLAGELFLEAANDITRLSNVHDHLKTLSLSPAESAKLIRERGKG